MLLSSLAIQERYKFSARESGMCFYETLGKEWRPDLKEPCGGDRTSSDDDDDDSACY